MSPSTSTEHAAAHFRRFLLGAVAQVIEQLARNVGSVDDLLEQFPFLRDYLDELDGATGGEWLARTREWESGIAGHLPLRAVRDSLHLDDEALTLFFAIGLIEEDPRFGFVIECSQPISPGQHRPTLSLLIAWWRDDDNGAAAVRERLRVLLDSGLLQVLNADAPRLQWVFQCPPPVWDALRGEMQPLPAPWLRFTSADELPSLDSIVLSDAMRAVADRAPRLLSAGEARTLIVRGPQHNGRRALARAVARALGRGVLELQLATRPEPERWALLGALATLANAIPLISIDLAPGETVELQSLAAFKGAVLVVMGKHGAVTGDLTDGAIALHLDMPTPAERRAMWSSSLETADADDLAWRFRMTTGNIRRAASLARSYALLEDRPNVTAADVRIASRALHREIETLAVHLPSSGDWKSMSVAEDTRDELQNLESRCLHREKLQGRVGEVLGRQLNAGVRALFAGPSGTGKTMAARILASMLQMDLYRLDLSAVVNKYVGETEKSLHQLFSRVEELDVVLLIDEGDALLTNRTSVQSSNDRYANLETNFLLQRLESFEGIVIVTTNAMNRIDPAFQRRMDVVVDFRLPDARERLSVWRLHLPKRHGIDNAWLQDAAVRCALSGGQIRNAVLHASLLALREGKRLAVKHAERAVDREYRKIGAVCPLRRRTSAGG